MLFPGFFCAACYGMFYMATTSSSSGAWGSLLRRALGLTDTQTLTQPATQAAQTQHCPQQLPHRTHLKHRYSQPRSLPSPWQEMIDIDHEGSGESPRFTGKQVLVDPQFSMALLAPFTPFSSCSSAVSFPCNFLLQFIQFYWSPLLRDPWV